MAAFRGGLFRAAPLLAALALLAGPASARAAGCAGWMNPRAAPGARAHALLGAMSLQDKVNLVTGDTGNPDPSYPNYGSAGVIFANPTLCIPALVLNDGGAGIADTQPNTTAFPDGVTQASSWDLGLMRQYGEALGREAFAKGVNVFLGPDINILRDPLNGRAWEFYGEDPFLSGQMSAQIVRGVQSYPVVATAKHYAADDQEGTADNNFGPVSNNVDPRTMQELELPPFQADLQAGAGAVMCTAALLNHVYACQNRAYLTGVLRGELGFTGWVMSDWQAAQSTAGSANGGMDMEMPSPQWYGPALAAAVQSGKVSMATLNTMVRRILFSMFRLGLFDHVPAEGSQAFGANASTPQSIATAVQVAEEGTVLLKNAGGLLPLAGPGERIAVIGSPASPQGAPLAEQGYGSAHVPEPGYPPNVVSPLQAISARAATAGDAVSYTDGSATADAAAAARAADVAIVFVSDVSSEGFDRTDLTPHAGTCDLVTQSGCSYSSVDQDALVSAVAAANPHTIVVLQNGGPLAMPWLGSVASVLENWFPGQVDGDAIAPLLFGDADPSGHLPETFPRALSDGPLRTAAQYPGVNGQVNHSERLLVGYRWYTARHIRPLFPFGFGLSYTTFRFAGLSVRSDHRGLTVRFRVTDTGRRAGAEVAQVYVSDPPRTGEPPLQLEGFRRVTLAPGTQATVTVRLAPRSLAYWSTRRGRWVIAAGCYGIRVGDSSVSLPLHGVVARGWPARRCAARRVARRSHPA